MVENNIFQKNVQALADIFPKFHLHQWKNQLLPAVPALQALNRRAVQSFQIFPALILQAQP